MNEVELSVRGLVDMFFGDCARTGLPPNENQLGGWLWFTCPAARRAEVRRAVALDARFLSARGDLPAWEAAQG